MCVLAYTLVQFVSSLEKIMFALLADVCVCVCVYMCACMIACVCVRAYMGVSLRFMKYKQTNLIDGNL
jgi:hypothetical protein